MPQNLEDLPGSCAGIRLQPRQSGQVKNPLRRTISRIATAAGAVGVLALGVASPAGATGTVDRAVPDDASRPAFANWFWFQQMAETFTPTRTGQLDQVDLFEGASGVPTPTPTGPFFTL